MAVDRGWESEGSNWRRTKADMWIGDFGRMQTSTGNRRLLRLFVTTGIAVGVGFSVVEVLREPFGPVRLFIKAIAPVALALPAIAVFSSGAWRTRVMTLLSLTTMGILTALCLGVYGVPLIAEVVLPILALNPPEPAPILAALSLLIGVTVLGGRYCWARLPARTVSDVLVAAGEAVYLGGFLIGATQNLGPLAWGVVGIALVFSARIRGVSTRRSVAGAAVFLCGMLWSENTYVAFLAHLALLGQPSRAGNSHHHSSVFLQARSAS